MKHSNQNPGLETGCQFHNSSRTSDARAVSEVHDVLSQILRDGAQKMLQAAIQKEVDEYLQERASITDESGRRLVIRNGSLPERELITGVGPVCICQPQIRDKRVPHEREVFTSSLLPKYLRKTKSIEEQVPWLYLKGISTNDFPEALQALIGKDAEGFSAITITRLKSVWEAEYDEWSKRSLKDKRYVYLWVDGIYSNIRFNDNEGRSSDENRQCLLVLMGATADGTKELIAVADGVRESELSWKELLLSMKARGHALLIPAIQLLSLTELAVTSHSDAPKAGLRADVDRLVQMTGRILGAMDIVRTVNDRQNFVCVREAHR